MKKKKSALSLVGFVWEPPLAPKSDLVVGKTLLTETGTLGARMDWNLLPLPWRRLVHADHVG
jgi:hypothetical protein